MKKLNVILVALVLLVGTTISAAPIHFIKEKKTVSQEIEKFLKNANMELEHDVNAYVTFMINEEQEVVVLTVDTDNETIARFIKSRLNYKKLENTLLQGEEYKVPVTMKAG